MGNLISTEPPAPIVIVPPLFDFPPLSTRTRMLESSYDVLFGKLALRSLFEDYFVQANHFRTMVLFKPVDDPHVDFLATVSGPLNELPEENIVGNALFRWQSDVESMHTYLDILVSNSKPILKLRSCAFFPSYGFGAFGIFSPLLSRRTIPEDYGVFGLRYGSQNLSIGTTVSPLALKYGLPKNFWVVGRIGKVTVGIQLEPQADQKKVTDTYGDLMNWSGAIVYGLGSGSPLNPSFTFSLELAKRSQFIASFYQHMVVQRRVKNPFEGDEVVGITNYIDVGFELARRIGGINAAKTIEDSALRMAASWQANKNFLIKGKVGTHSSSLAVALKSWWKPSFTFNISATRDHWTGKTSYGFGIHIENLREASYERADPNYVMLTPNKEHLAEGIHWKVGKRPMFESDVLSGNFDGLPTELRSPHNIL